MSNDEAKFLLGAYRPNGRDALDPALAGAVAQAKADPALAEWFARAQAHDGVVAGKLAEIAPPAGLREAVLAGARASQPATVRRSGWRHPKWLATAAAVALLIGALAWRWFPAGGANLESFALNFVSRGFLLQKRGADVAQLRAWLDQKHGPLPVALPTEFARLHALGCRKLSFEGRDVSLICFERDGKEFHLFVARRDDFPAEPLRAAPALIDRRPLVAAAWSDEAYRYVLVSDAGAGAVRALLL